MEQSSDLEYFEQMEADEWDLLPLDDDSFQLSAALPPCLEFTADPSSTHGSFQNQNIWERNLFQGSIFTSNPVLEERDGITRDYAACNATCPGPIQDCSITCSYGLHTHKMYRYDSKRDAGQSLMETETLHTKLDLPRDNYEDLISKLSQGFSSDQKGNTSREPTDCSSTVKVKQIKSHNPSPFLPPCKVCGDQATGFHYGVSTCEPCKGFFRRSVVKICNQKQSYNCAGSGNCTIGPDTRQSCSYCRYRKCIEVGMSMNAKKTGRYSYEKWTQITHEVKSLERIERGFKHLNIQKEQAEEIILNLVTVQRRLNPKLAAYFDGNLNAQDEQTAVLESYIRRIEMFGRMSVLPKEVYEEFYKRTGIDVDNRQSLMRNVLARIEKIIKNIIEYMRYIPELKELSLQDQTALVKASHFEFGFLGLFHGMNKELNVITGDSIRIHKEDAAKVLDKSFLDDVFECANKFKCLMIAEEELALCRGISICFSDRCVLQEPDKVDRIQWRLISCLRYFAINKGYNPDQRICQIFDRLTSLRSVSGVCQKLDMEKIKWPAAEDHPLVVDVLSS